MKKLGNSLYLTKAQAEWLFRNTLKSLNRSNDTIYHTVKALNEGAEPNERVIQAYQVVLNNATNERRSSIEVLVKLLDKADRHLLAQAFEVSDEDAKISSDKGFSEWLVVASAVARIDLIKLSIANNEMVFEVTKLSEFML